MSRAQAGDAAAQLALGTLYDLGDGAPQNARVAFGWYRRAAEAGLPAAEFNVAVMLDSGRGTARNLSEAATWYARAAAHGNRRAQYNLAQLYEAGQGVPRNAELAAAWLREAAHDLPAAERRLAALHPDDHPSGSAVTAAIPIAPQDRAASGSGLLELVWTSVPQPEPVRFFVEVRKLDATGSHEVFSDFTDGSALLAPFPGAPGAYAWRVFTLTNSATHYALSEWARFTVPLKDAAKIAARPELDGAEAPSGHEGSEREQVRPGTGKPGLEAQGAAD